MKRTKNSPSMQVLEKELEKEPFMEKRFFVDIMVNFSRELSSYAERSGLSDGCLRRTGRR